MEENIPPLDVSKISTNNVDYALDKDSELTVLKPVEYDFNELPKTGIFNKMDIDNHNVNLENSIKNTDNPLNTCGAELNVEEQASKLDLASESTDVVNSDETVEQSVEINGDFHDSDTNDNGRKTPDSSPSTTPGKSRYGRVRKPKLSTDFISVDKKSFAVLNNASSYEPVYADETPHKIPPKRKNKRSYRRRSNVLLIRNESKTETQTNSVEEPLEKISYIAQSISSIEKSTNVASPENEVTCPLYDTTSALSCKDTLKTYSRKNETSIPATSNLEEQTDQVESTSEKTPQINYPELNWKVGDVAWAKIGCYPYWPSIVTLEYGSSIYVRSVGNRRLAVHVQFFGDRGRRSWVLTTSLIKYQSKEQFLELKQQCKKDRKERIKMKYFVIKPSFSDLWEKAVNEADTILKLPHDERIQYYQSLYPMSLEAYLADKKTGKVKRHSSYTKKNPEERRGRKRKIFSDSSIDLPVKKVKKKSKSDDQLENTNKTKIREPMEEHIKMRRAFIRRMNKILNQSNDRSNYSVKKGMQNGLKLQQLKNATFNKLLNKENEKNKQNLNSTTGSVGTSSSPDSVQKKTDLSVYDFESDDETDVFIGTYNSKFTPQILAKIEQDKNEKLFNGETNSPQTSEIEESPTENNEQICEPNEVKKRRLFLDEKLTDSDSSSTKKKSNEKCRPRKPIDWLKKGDDGRSTNNADNSFGNITMKKLRDRMTNNTNTSDKKTEAKVDKENDFKKRSKKNYKLNGGFETFRDKLITKVVTENPQFNENEIEKQLEKMWNELSDNQKSKYKLQFREDNDNSDDEEDIDEESKIEEKRRSSSPLPVLRNKKSILFAGLKSEKVCQICEKPGETVRCKGSCCGSYHIDCVNKTPEKKTRVKKSVEKLESEKNEKIEMNEAVESKNDNEAEENISDDKKCDDVESENFQPRQLRTRKINEEMKPKISKKTEDEVDGNNVETRVNDSDNGEEISNSAIVNVSEKSLDNSENVNLNEQSKEEESEVSTKEKENIVANDVVNGDVVENDETRKSDVSENLSNSKTDNSNGVDFRCKSCANGVLHPCFTCGKEVEEKTGDSERFCCYLAYCGHVFHKECLKDWPQATWGTNSGKSRANTNGKESLMCPQHYCHTCISDNPAVLKNKQTNEKLVKCIRCPTAYHQRVHCIPAGSELLTMTQIICPRHYEPPKLKNTHVNAYWCFICCIGGSLICCEECPTSFHAECLKLSPEEYEGKYICDDCQTGRYLLYGEVVWVKLGYYRWWPAQILFPHQIPDNIANMSHRRGEFAVKFFGSHDYNWVNRGRTFLYQEGDSGRKNCKKSNVDVVFEKALTEAEEAYQKLKSDKAIRDEEAKKPPRYVRIKANKPVGNVRIVELNTSNIPDCKCDPSSERPCAPESDCLNRMLLVECNPRVCSAGDRCLNQAFEKRLYPPLMPYKTDKRGWGLKTLVDIKKGDFIIEYVGEMIDEDEYKRRINHMYKNQEENYYFLTIDKDRMLDAGPKGNVSRFMNHSCDPNCETQKWTVNGDTRVGLFALKNISANDELVFNYNLATLGNEKKPCLCGSDKCSGFIGVKAVKNGNNGDEESRKRSAEENRKRSGDYTKKKLNLSKRKKRGKKLVKRLKTKQKPLNNRVQFKKKLTQQNKKHQGKIMLEKKMEQAEKNNLSEVDNCENQEKPDETEKPDDSVLEQAQSKELSDSEEKDEVKEISLEDDLLDLHPADCEASKSGIENAEKSPIKIKMQKKKKSVRGRKRLASSKLEKSKKLANRKSKRGRKPLLKNKKKIKVKNNRVILKSNILNVNPVMKKKRGRKPLVTEQEIHEGLYKSLKKRIDRKIKSMSEKCKLDETCFICDGEGRLFVCDNKVCPKRYHLTCVKKFGLPKGRWLCPWHYCRVCNSKRQVVKCSKCINSFCQEHVEGNVFITNLKNFVCKFHKPGGKVVPNSAFNFESDSFGSINTISDLSNVTESVAAPRAVGRRSTPFKNRNISNVVIKDECLSDTENERIKMEENTNSDESESETEEKNEINQNESKNSNVLETAKETDSFDFSDDDYVLEVIQVEDS